MVAVLLVYTVCVYKNLLVEGYVIEVFYMCLSSYHQYFLRLSRLLVPE